MADEPFRLLIVEAGDQWVVTCTSSHGDAVGQIPAPFSREVLDRNLHDIEMALLRSYSRVTTRRAAPVDQCVREFGKKLSGAVLTGDVGLMFDRCRQDARERRTPLRVLLAPVGPNVSVIPWEFLIDPHAPDDYLALRIPIARTPHTARPASSSRIALPLRVLCVSARPADLPELDTKSERDDISEAFQQQLTSGDVYIEWLPGDRWSDLADAIRAHPWHVLHIMSHGGFDEDDDCGYIQLSGDDGNAQKISAVDLARPISENPSLRLVVLNACESALAGTGGAFTSTAAKLVREGVAAVVAMQYEISDTAALEFAKSFYRRIAGGEPVDRAITRAREAVKMSKGSLEWATPVLFLSSNETQIFEVPEKAEAAKPQDIKPEPQDIKPEPQSIKPEPQSTPRAEPKQAEERVWEPPPPPPPPPPPDMPVIRRLQVLRPAGPSVHMAGGPRDLFAIAGNDGVVRVLRTSTGQVLSECVLPQRTRPVQLAWSPWPRHLASLHEDGTTAVWDAETEMPVRLLRASGQQWDKLQAAARRIDSLRAIAPGIDAIAFSSNGKWLAATGGGSVHFFDANGNRARELKFETGNKWFGPKSGASRVVFAPGDQRILVAVSDGTVLEFDVQGRILMRLPHPQPVLGMAVTQDRLATGSADGRVRIWSWEGQLIRRAGLGAPVEHLAFSPDGSWLVTAASDGALSLWNREGTVVAKAGLSGRPVGVRCDHDTVLTANQAGALEVWSLEIPGRGGRPS